MKTPHLSGLLLAALLAFGAPAAHAADDAPSVSKLIDLLGPATQPGATDDWGPQRRAEADTARQIRERIAARPGADELTAVDPLGRTPLVRAALRGYADVVDALLTDAQVRAAINVKGHDGLSAWMAAQMARPLTLAACYPQVLTREAVGLWGANLRRIAYFSQQPASPFDRIRLALAAAGAQPDLAAAKRYWLDQCPGHDPALDAAIAASEDLTATLLADANPRLQAFFAELQRVYRPFAPRQLPPQPVLRASQKQVKPDGPVQPAVMQCAEMPKPDIETVGDVTWEGNFVVQVLVDVQDSVPVAASLQVLQSPRPVPMDAAMRLRAVVYAALGKYRCNGDHLFEQEFHFLYR